ncbi:N-succinyl-L,L-diaminopimelate aminotransferase, type 2 [hydrothermal vent metagenome]|uniref:N-succinyl-L,L-diaminopimelate aminotransferase, type 2 n=1 Tax=hydrothermal vent metagenome TaxID=652676 RepID=A0A3B0Y1A9_9ZZZZ
MNPDLHKLQPYPFERLKRLKKNLLPPKDKSTITLSIGEPKHPAPDFIAESLHHNVKGLSQYPLTRGTKALRQSIEQWLTKRFSLESTSLCAEQHILPVNGTREALFAFAQCVVDRHQNPIVMMPNPFYQIYEGAALLAGAEPWFMNCTHETGFKPDFEVAPEVWQQCQLIYICSPGNPTGAVLSIAELQSLIHLADQYDFIIAADECYSEIYQSDTQAPPGLLEAAAKMGRPNFERCIVFHSLSKRSNAPGLRSGFVAGDASIIEQFHLYRTYHGSAMSPQVQAASAITWKDEQHVRHNRALYTEKFEKIHRILSPLTTIEIPDAGFYFWLATPDSDEKFFKDLYHLYNLTVLPGSYLSRESQGINPGKNYVRIALVPPLEQCIEAADRIRQYIESL